MKEYIERQAAISILNAKSDMALGTPKQCFAAAAAMLEKLPTADVVEVVRCKDCDVPHNRWTGCPYLNGLIPPPDFYCAYGKRKIDKEE